MIGVAVLGSTGSIGDSTLDVLRRHAGQFRVVALSAQRSVDRLVAQCREFAPEFAAMADPACAAALQQQLTAAGLATRVVAGPDAAAQVAVLPQVHYVMAAIVGAAGLGSTLAAAAAGKRLMIA